MLNMFSIKDKKAGIFSTPFFVPNVVVAMRSVSDAMRDPESQLCKYPEDFALYRLGEFDEQLGDIVNAPDAPVLISHLTELKKP